MVRVCERVGLDPQGDSYRAAGIDAHAMQEVCAPAEAIPFEIASVDIITCFNALDYVEDPSATAGEMVRGAGARRVIAVG